MAKIETISRKTLLGLHQYQFNGSHRNPNECTLCSMTMLLEMGAQKIGHSLDLAAVELGKELDRIPFRFPRFPAWFPGPGGATHPLAAYWGLQGKANRLRKAGRAFPWQPTLRLRQTPEDLREQLAKHNPTMIYGVGRTGVPHVVVPIANTEGKWEILDPGFPTAKNPRVWSDKTLIVWWRNFGWFYPRGTMISLWPLED